MSYFNYSCLNPRTLYTYIHAWHTKCYVPEGGGNGKELKAATDAALKIKLYRLDVGIKLKEVPLAENPNWPTRQDFVKLEQWFISAIEPEEVFPMDESPSKTKPKTKRKKGLPAQDKLNAVLSAHRDWTKYKIAAEAGVSRQWADKCEGFIRNYEIAKEAIAQEIRDRKRQT